MLSPTHTHTHSQHRHRRNGVHYVPVINCKPCTMNARTHAHMHTAAHTRRNPEYMINMCRSRTIISFDLINLARTRPCALDQCVHTHTHMRTRNCSRTHTGHRTWSGCARQHGRRWVRVQVRPNTHTHTYRHILDRTPPSLQSVHSACTRACGAARRVRRLDSGQLNLAPVAGVRRGFGSAGRMRTGPPPSPPVRFRVPTTRI